MNPDSNAIIGDGNTPSALTDLRDIGHYVARIIADPRTLNKMVFTYNELLTQDQIYRLMEHLSGEKIERTYVCFPFRRSLDGQILQTNFPEKIEADPLTIS